LIDFLGPFTAVLGFDSLSVDPALLDDSDVPPLSFNLRPRRGLLATASMGSSSSLTSNLVRRFFIELRRPAMRIFPKPEKLPFNPVLSAQGVGRTGGR